MGVQMGMTRQMAGWPDNIAEPAAETFGEMEAVSTEMRSSVEAQEAQLAALAVDYFPMKPPHSSRGW